MSEPDSPRAAGRIVVVFDTTPLGEAALEAAAGLAAALEAELAGLFVEDIDLVRMAQLPFAAELGLASAVLRRIEASDLERAFRLQAERSRERLAAAGFAAQPRSLIQIKGLAARTPL